MESGIREGLESIVGPPHVPTGASSHDGSVDERIRRIKDNMRALQAGLPYELGDAQQFGVHTMHVMFSTCFQLGAAMVYLREKSSQA